MNDRPEPRPAGTLHKGAVAAVPALATTTDAALLRELLARLDARQLDLDSELQALGARLLFALRERLDVHENRFALARYRTVFDTLFGPLRPDFTFEGRTIVELGCGGLNPGGLLFAGLALGAARGIAVDLDDIAHPVLAVRALADVAAAMLLDAARVAGDFAIPATQVLANLASFDLARLHAGDGSGIDAAHLCFRQESAAATSLATGEADLIFSSAFLEHVPDVAAVLREAARITRPGGLGAHTIDLTDHRRYTIGVHPLQFLAEPGEGLVHGSNRWRRGDFVRAFAAAGFVVEDCTTLQRFEVPDRLRATFVAPFRDLADDELAAGIVRIVVRRSSAGTPPRGA